jgi:hypothetical protein
MRIRQRTKLREIHSLNNKRPGEVAEVDTVRCFFLKVTFACPKSHLTFMWPYTLHKQVTPKSIQEASAPKPLKYTILSSPASGVAFTGTIS